MQQVEEVVKLINAYVQESEEVQGKYEILGQKWSNWAGNYWDNLGLFETKEEADEQLNKIMSK